MALDLNRLREIGFAEWDPIGLMRNRETWVGTRFQNEYDHYLIRVADRLVAGDDEAELVAYLVGVECVDMEVATAEKSAPRARATVAAIKAHVTETLTEQPYDIKKLVESRFPGWQVVERESLESGGKAIPTEQVKFARWGLQVPSPEEIEREKMTGQVVIEPKNGGGPGPKTVIVRNGKIIGAQG
ncbi:hypothetical protein [Rhizobium sp. BK176]|uniref:hypothetical protein n=1 Tax=Rhizobium sp. BK176 TaxID=2587071 RepID=UPI002167BCF4|nr:hypothetical protein [Rhizobium sp. BK176]MCS4089529.1 hypothetical protein [Rhizobium sp. BK176]